jgi:hypothetical protein
MALALARGWALREIRPERRTLEDLFVEITAREEAEAPAAR